MPEVGVGTVTIKPDMTGFRSAMAKEAGPAVEGLTRDINGKLRDARGKFVAESGALGAAGGSGFAAKFGAMSVAGLNKTLGKMRTVGKRMTMALTLPILGVGVTALKAGANFEKSMDVLASSADASADQMQALTDKAMALGDDLKLPGTSASDAAQAMLELSKAGLSVNDTLAASRGVLQLSAAGQIDNATAANLTASALLAFNLQGTEATRIADLLAAGANESLASVEDMGLAMQMAGSVFAAAGIPIEDMITSVAQLANAGVSGSDAGTSLKSMLLKLQNPSKEAAGTLEQLGLSLYNADGSMKDFRQVIAEMSGSMVGLTQQQKDQALATVFGADAVRSANILIADGAEGFDAMKTKVTETGAAQKAAEAQTKGLSGAWDAVTSALDTAAIKLTARFLPFFTDLARNIADLIGQFANLPTPVLAVVAGFGLLLALAGPLVYIVGALGTVITFLLTPVGLTIAGIALLAAGLVIAYQKFEGFREIVDTVAAFLRDTLTAAAQTLIDLWNDELYPALIAVGDYLRDVVWPAFLTGAAIVRDYLIVAVEWLVALWNEHLYPALIDVTEFVRDVVWPTWLTFATFMKDVVVAYVLLLVDVWNNYLWPAIQAVAAYLVDVVWPAFQVGVDVVREKVVPVLGQIVDFFKTYILPIIQTVARYFVQVLWPAIRDAIGWAAKTIKQVWDQVLGPVFRFITGLIIDVLVPAFKVIAVVVGAVFVAVVAAIEVAWSIIKPIFEFIKDVIANVLLPVFIFLKNVVVDFVFPLIVAIIKDTWEIIQPIFGFVVDLIKNTLGPVFEALATVVGVAFLVIVGAVKVFWELVEPILDAVITFVGEKLNPIWEGLSSAVKTAWDKVPGIIGGVLRAVGAVIARFLRTSADLADAVGLDSIAKAMRSGADAADKWGETKSKAKPGKTDRGQGGIAVEGGMRRARGGLIPGPNVARDIVPVMAMPGEFYVRKSAVDKFGAQFFAELNAGRLPPLAAGGAVNGYPSGWNRVTTGAGVTAGGGASVGTLQVTTIANANADEVVAAINAKLGWMHTTRRDR